MKQNRFACLTGFFLLAISIVQAQPQQKLVIEQATVFLSGAELISTAKLNLNKGENEILFTNVAGDVNSQSLSVSATNGVVVASATFQNNYLATEALSPKAQQIKDSIELMTEYKQLIHNKIVVIDEQLAVLRENRKVGGAQTGLSVAELTKMLDLINTRMENYLNQKNKHETVVKKTDERITKLNKQLEEEQKKDYQPGGQLLVKFYAKEATSTSIAVNYIVPHAGWSPTYDIWADDASGPVKLYYKANIYQNSGVKWDNVRLSLSTGNPNEGVQAPVMSPWYLTFYSPQVYDYKNINNDQSRASRAYSANRYKSAESPSVASGGANMEQSSINEYVTIDNSGVNTTFDIELPYTIPSDSKQHLVAIKRFELPATYRYYSVPKLDKDVFLQAKITNWEDLNLLPGTTNIFYEGTYVGQGAIDPRNVKDTMVVSLGRDKKIVVKRVRNTKLRSVKYIGTNVRETFAYTITLRNARKEIINLTIQDQQPISNDNSIVIEEKDLGNSEYNETTGLMNWTVTLNPNESKELNFGYTVKYPKGKTVTGL
ncbi:MAG: mucoidy inhibitor MuiA family protein [Flavipsychrobacter sp.]|nr:mucoidy inhibitor MuiA family protein [Flavipsychrobacter sp.]